MKRFFDWLAAYRSRLLIRSAFALLALAVLAMALTVLQGEKQRSHDNYQTSLAKTKEQIVGRLRHPSGQLALLNPPRAGSDGQVVHAVVLPFAALDFDDQNKVRNAVELAGCLVQYPHFGSLCVAIGNDPWAGGFIYAAGTFASGPLAAHVIGDELIDGAHRLRVTAQVRGQTSRWLAPFELLPASPRQEGVRGRFTGYVEQAGANYRGAKPVRDFRGWVWQSGVCLEPAEQGNADCEKQSFFSLRLPIDVLIDALFRQEKLQWPPPDLDQFRIRIELLPPASGEALFDSDDQAGAVAPFSLNQLTGLLLPGESLAIRKVGREADLIKLTGQDDNAEPASPLLTRLIRLLPVEIDDAPLELQDTVTTPLGNYRLLLQGDARSVNKTLSVVATRLSWFVIAMLGAIGLAWLVTEIGLVRPIARLSNRTRGLAKTVYAEDTLERYELADLRGKDEVGTLATGLDELLRRVREDAERERIRAEQEKDLWHAVGHEIMSPLQSLLALHGSEADPSHRYLQRMQQAVRILYGSASPSEAFQASHFTLQAMDIREFVHHVAENCGIDRVVAQLPENPLLVRADAYPLEDVFSHLLKNADRYRQPGSEIRIELGVTGNTANIRVFNLGPTIAADMIDKIFEYGVSDQAEAAANGNRGQGLFVAKTYMAKMGGTIAVKNEPDGVSFILGLPLAHGHPV